MNKISLSHKYKVKGLISKYSYLVNAYNETLKNDKNDKLKVTYLENTIETIVRDLEDIINISKCISCFNEFNINESNSKTICHECIEEGRF